MSDEMSFADYEGRLDRSIKVKVPDFSTGERLRHLIFSGQFTRPMLDKLCRLADKIRLLAKSNEGHRFLNTLLSHKRAMLYFTQPSTRTFMSFAAACQILGMTVNEVRDLSVSSEAKGESPFDSMRMFSSYFDLVIMRSHIPKFAECCGYMMNHLASTQQRSVPILNAGAGSDEHPTQALLDIYTIQRAFSFTDPKDSRQWTRFDELRETFPGLRKGIVGKTIGFCGDIRRGRTVRSLAQLLALHDQIRLVFISPAHPTLALPRDLKDKLIDAKVDVRECHSLLDSFDGKPLIEQLDALYMTRIQREHNSPEEEAELKDLDYSQFKLSKPLVARMKPYAAILHPFPRDKDFGEIPPAIDDDERAHYFRQARNGMWARAALVAHIFDVDGEINDYHEQYNSERQIAPQ